MRQSWIGAACAAGLALSTVGPLCAQEGQQEGQRGGQQDRQLAPAQPAVSRPAITNDEGDVAPATHAPANKPARPRAQKSTSAFEHDPDLDDADQLAPSQLTQPMPAAVAEPSGAPAPSAGPNAAQSRAKRGAPATVMTEPAARTKPPAAAAPPPSVVCGGVFAKDSNRLKLAAAFQKRNVADSQVVTAAGGKAMASVLYGKDPQQRLEIWWSNPADRSDIHLIVITGKSNWSAPGGLRLGLSLAEVEELNGKPFKLVGFNKDGTAAASDWNGGALATQTGGCKLGISVRPDPASPTAAVAALGADREFPSTDAALRAINPTVIEILIAY
jgi:hypothetical protein